MSLLHDSHHPSMQNSSTSSTLDSIKNFFNGGRTSKSMHSKRAQDNVKNLEGNLSNLQPLLVDSSQSDALWRYPTNDQERLPNRINVSSEYSAVYQPHITKYEQTLRMSDYSNKDTGQDVLNNDFPPIPNIINKSAPGMAVNSLLVDSSFSSSSSYSNHNQNDNVKSCNKFPNLPKLPSTLSTSSCSCSSSASAHGIAGCKESKPLSDDCQFNGKKCKNNKDNGACSTTTTNSSSAGSSSDGNFKTSPYIHPCSQQSVNDGSNFLPRAEISQMDVQHSPCNQLYHPHPTGHQVSSCIPLNEIRHGNTTRHSELGNEGKQGIGSIFNSLWKSRNRKSNKAGDGALMSDIATCNHCQKIATSRNGHICSCNHRSNYVQNHTTDSRGAALTQDIVPLRVPPLPSMQMLAYDRGHIETWQATNKTTHNNLKEGDDRRYFLHNRNQMVIPSTPKTRTELQQRPFGTLSHSYRQKFTVEMGSSQIGMGDNDSQSTSIISMKQRGLTLGPSKRNQNSNRGVMPNPDDILPKEAWTDFSGRDNWPKPLVSTHNNTFTDDNINGGNASSASSERITSERNNASIRSPIYVNIENEDSGDVGHQRDKRYSENLRDNGEIESKPGYSIRPKPLPRRQSSIRSAASPEQNKNCDKTSNHTKSKNYGIINKPPMDLPSNDPNDEKFSPSFVNDDDDDHTIDENPNGFHPCQIRNKEHSLGNSDEQVTSDSLTTNSKDQGIELLKNRGLPPLPKQRDKLFSDTTEIKTFQNEEKVEEKQNGRKKTYTDMTKASNRRDTKGIKSHGRKINEN